MALLLVSERPQALPLPAELGVIALWKAWASAVVLFRLTCIRELSGGKRGTPSTEFSRSATAGFCYYSFTEGRSAGEV
jgi:hypothetical protein